MTQAVAGISKPSSGDNSSPQKPEKRRWLRRLVRVCAFIVTLFAAVLTVLLIHFDNAYFKNLIEQTIKDRLGRECQVASVDVSYWNGRASCSGLKILNAGKGFKENETVRLAGASIQLH